MEPVSRGGHLGVDGFMGSPLDFLAGFRAGPVPRMTSDRFSLAELLRALRALDTGGELPITDAIPEHSLRRWQRALENLTPEERRQLDALAEENEFLIQVLARLSLVNEAQRNALETLEQREDPDAHRRGPRRQEPEGEAGAEQG